MDKIVAEVIGEIAEKILAVCEELLEQRSWEKTGKNTTFLYMVKQYRYDIMLDDCATDFSAHQRNLFS